MNSVSIDSLSTIQIDQITYHSSYDLGNSLTILSAVLQYIYYSMVAPIDQYLGDFMNLKQSMLIYPSISSFTSVHIVQHIGNIDFHLLQVIPQFSEIIQGCKTRIVTVALESFQSRKRRLLSMVEVIVMQIIIYTLRTVLNHLVHDVRCFRSYLQ